MNMNPAPQGLAGFLHVVFHGAFCFFDNGNDNIDVLVPLVKNHMNMSAGDNQGTAMPSAVVAEHTYIAGNWLNERTFMSTKFELTGVERGNARFDRTKNLHLIGARLADNAGDQLYARMTFPRPDRIHSLQRGPVAAATFSGNDAGMVDIAKDGQGNSTQEVSTVQVFTYRFLDHQKLALPPHPPSAFQGDGHLTGGFCSLHLFAEPDNRPPDDQHAHHAFKAGLAMYRKADGTPINLDIVNPPRITPVQQQDVPFGTILAELEDLPTRLGRLSALGVRRLENDNLNGIFDPIEGEDASDPLNCLSMTGF